MGNSILSLLLLDKIRVCFKRIQKNVLQSSMVFLFGILILFSLGDMITFLKVYLPRYFDIISVFFLIYSISKLLQELPIMAVDYRLLQLRILKLWQFKLLILIKCLALSGIIVIMSFIGDIFYLIEPKNIIILCVINSVVNLVCFLKTQIKSKVLIISVTVISIGLAYYFNSLILISGYFVLCLIYFIKSKSIKYDEILEFYKYMLIIKQGIINNNVEQISCGKCNLNKEKIKEGLSLLQKYYDKNHYFEFYKEISRGLVNYKTVVNMCLINFSIGLIVNKSTDLALVNSVALLVVLFISEQILVSLNTSEKRVISAGFYYPYTLKEIIKNKYIAHVLIVSLPIIASFFLFNKISFIYVILCILILPIKSIVSTYSNKFLMKCISNLLTYILFALCFINNVF